MSWYLLLLGGALAALSAIVLLLQWRSLSHELDTELSAQAAQLAADHYRPLLSLDPALELSLDDKAAAAPVVVRRASGELIFQGAQFPKLDWAGEQIAAAAAREGAPLATASGRTGTVRFATVVVRRGGAEPLAVQVGRNASIVTAALLRLGLLITMFTVVTLGVASYGGSLIAKNALRPVDEIVRRVQAIQADRIHERLAIDEGSAEIDRLVATLNNMLERIGGSVEAARRFAADASHELQTPLTALRNALELCARGKSEHHPPTVAADLLVEVDRLSTLIRDLRLLALAEAGRVAAVESVDLAAIALECSDTAQALAEEKGVEVCAGAHHHPRVLGNPAYLRRAILNLLQNAIQYSAPATRILVDVSIAKQQAMVIVHDHGCGIGSDDVKHIFEPFYRADPARCRETGGSGLGLAIVDRIVRLHGGFVRVASVPGRGSTFVVYLPQQRVSARDEVDACRALALN